MRTVKWLLSLSVFLLCALISYFLHPVVPRSSGCVFVLAVLFTSVITGTAAGVATAVLSVLVASFFFMDPIGSFKVYSSADALQLFVLVVTAVVVGVLNSRKAEAEYWLRVSEEARINKPPVES